MQKLKDWRFWGETRKDTTRHEQKGLYCIELKALLQKKKCVKNAYRGTEGNSLNCFWIDIFRANITVSLLLHIVNLRLYVLFWLHAFDVKKSKLHLLWKFSVKSHTLTQLEILCIHLRSLLIRRKILNTLFICMTFAWMLKLNLGLTASFDY